MLRLPCENSRPAGTIYTLFSRLLYEAPDKALHEALHGALSMTLYTEPLPMKRCAELCKQGVLYRGALYSKAIRSKILR